MIDCHIHSSFSLDSKMPVIAACERAVSLGLDGLTFTDHLDYDYPGFEFQLIDFDEYSRYMEDIKKQYRGKLEIFKGIEVGIQPHVMDETNKVVVKHDFDMVIASTHIIDKMDPYTGDYYQGKSKYQADLRYLEEILNAVNNFKNYDVVGHIGYIRRYNPYDDKSLRCNDYSDILELILKTILHDGKGIEINSSGYRSGLDSPIPDYDIVKRYKELGGEILTVGSDAHCPEHMGFAFGTVKEHLKNIGFKYITHFEGRKPVFTKI